MHTNRRNFLKSASLTALGCASRDSLQGAAGDAIVVTVLLNGGNDGLNTVVPIGDAQYALYEKARPKLKIARDQVIKLANTDPAAGQPNGPYGLHPVLTGLNELYQRGNLAIVAGVGVPRDSESMFDHAAGVYDFVTSDPYHLNFHSARPTGWLGRALDGVPAKEVPPGLDFGGGGLLLAGSKTRPISLGTITDFQLLAGDIALAAYRDLMEYERPDSAIAEFNRTQRRTAINSGSFLRERTKNYKPAVAYPANNRLADNLRDVASVIWANLGARGFSVALGGFDTHKGQNQNNLHAGLLKTFSDAVTAFYNDLRAQNLSRNVIIVTLSDFGRRPEENSELGTDHGYANCCFVIGDKVKSGMHGVYPSLESAKLVFDQNLDITVDYRAVLATILARHLDVDPKPVVGVSETLSFL